MSLHYRHQASMLILYKLVYENWKILKTLEIKGLLDVQILSTSTGFTR